MEKDIIINIKRTLLFTPGLRIDRFVKAVKGNSDMVCLDLEDGVAPTFKDEARLKAIPALAELSASDKTGIRINSIKSQDGMRDLLELCDFGVAPSSILLPKVDSPEEVKWVAEILFQAGFHKTRLMVIIETVRGLHAASEIALASKVVDTLLFGGADLSAEMGASLDWEAMLYARGKVIHAAATAELGVIDVPHLDINDVAGLKKEAELAQRMGFTGKAAIHPIQVPVINDIFSPTEEKIAFAKRVIEAYENSSHGVTLLDGKVVEIPVVKAMRRALLIDEKIKSN